jgi:iron complex transport system substrate-binding protein
MRTRRLQWGIAAALAALIGTEAAAEPGPPARIVSIGGAVSEIVHALGFADRIVAVDSTSRHPDALAKKPNIGYMRRLSAEPIVALTPDLVLYDADFGPAVVLRQLAGAGIRLVRVPAEPTVAGIRTKVRTVAEALGVPKKGAALAVSLDRELKAASAYVALAGSRPRVMFILSTGRGVPLVGGRGTAADSIIRLAGGTNAVSGFKEYKPLAPEAAVAAAPDVLLVTRRSLEMVGGKAKLLAMPGLSSTPAAEAGRVVAMDGLLLLGFGLRTGEAISTLARALHPGLKPEALAR